MLASNRVLGNAEEAHELRFLDVIYYYVINLRNGRMLTDKNFRQRILNLLITGLSDDMGIWDKSVHLRSTANAILTM